MKIYLAGTTMVKDREKMLLDKTKMLSGGRLLSYYYIIIDKDIFYQERSFKMIREINEKAKCK